MNQYDEYYSCHPGGKSMHRGWLVGLDTELSQWVIISMRFHTLYVSVFSECLRNTTTHWKIMGKLFGC